MYTTRTTLWKFFYHSPKRCEHLKEVQKELDLPELKITKPSDTRWLAHERCVSAVKKCYGAIVTTLKQIYEESHEPEALGLSKILTRPSTLFTIYLLDFVLPQVSKLNAFSPNSWTWPPSQGLLMLLCICLTILFSQEQIGF